MNLSFEIPDDLAQRLSRREVDLSRRAQEKFTLKEYRAGRVSKAEVRLRLGIETRYELDGFLKQRHVYIEATVEDLRRDEATLERLGF